MRGVNVFKKGTYYKNPTNGVLLLSPYPDEETEAQVDKITCSRSR